MDRAINCQAKPLVGGGRPWWCAKSVNLPVPVWRWLPTGRLLWRGEDGRDSRWRKRPKNDRGSEASKEEQALLPAQCFLFKLGPAGEVDEAVFCAHMERVCRWCVLLQPNLLYIARPSQPPPKLTANKGLTNEIRTKRKKGTCPLYILGALFTCRLRRLSERTYPPGKPCPKGSRA